MRNAETASGNPRRAKTRLVAARDLRIGIFGWTYKPWRGVFYPLKHPQNRELEYASRRLNSIEINGTFYSLQRPASFQRWRAAPARHDGRGGPCDVV